MDEVIDFNKVTPCGEFCEHCHYKQDKTCKGCRETNGSCIKMWSNGCQIFKCCLEHKVLFCGLCSEFPCKYIVKKITSWNPSGIDNLREIADKYNKQKIPSK